MARPLIILSHPRSGSYYLGRSLAAAEGVRWDCELLHWDRIRKAPLRMIDLWIESVRAWRSDRIVAAKAFCWSAELVEHARSQEGVSMMSLWRRDGEAATVSTARAWASNQWVFPWKRPKGEPPDELVERCRHYLTFPQDPVDFKMVSEDLWSDPRAELDRLGEWLGIRIPPVRAYSFSSRSARGS